MAHTEWLLGVQLRHFSPTCAVLMEDCWPFHFPLFSPEFCSFQCEARVPIMYISCMITIHAGRILLQHNIEFQLLPLEPNTDPPTFTLTCVTIGGPPSNVTWTRDNIEIDYQSNSNFTFSRTVTNLDTSTYHNTLTVTGRYPGQYSMTTWNRNTLVYISNQFATSAILVTGKHLLEKHGYTMLLNTDIVFTCSCCPTHQPHCCARL